MPSYRDMTAPQLVVHWKKFVNDNVNMGRDSRMLKDFLGTVTPVQILLGMYQYEGNGTITIPQFIHAQDDWVEFDEVVADIELATLISRKIPPDYYVWKDYKDEQTAEAYELAFNARQALKQWADRILG